MKRILVIDDEANQFIDRLREKLSLLDFKIDFEISGEEGIQRLKNSPGKYSLIFLDGYFNGRVDGIKFLNTIRSFDTKTAIVCISNDSKIAEIMVKKGAQTSISKGNLFILGIEQINKILERLLISPNSIKKVNELKNFVRIFLPLDIDLQALLLVEDRGKSTGHWRTSEYLAAVYTDNVDYLTKFNQLKQFANGNKPLMRLCGSGTVGFFKKLAKKSGVDELLNHRWNIHGINSFHDWYCQLTDLIMKGGE